MQTSSLTSLMPKPRRVAVFIPTNLPADDPRDLSPRAIARFEAGMACARRLRAELGRANVLVVLFGGWPLHKRIPLAIHHAYAAIMLHRFLTPDELDFVASYGVSTTTDLHGTLTWMKEHILNVQEAYVVTSRGHAERLVAESDMPEAHPHEFDDYITGIWNLMCEFEETNVVVRSRTPGCWRLDLNL